MQRVLVLGCSGTGKSSLARRLGRATGLPVIHLDQHFWRPGWVEPEAAEWQAQAGALAAQPRWIIEGNYAATLPQRLAVADTVIFLDLPTWRCLARVLWRTLLGWGRVRVDMAPGCPDRFEWAFIKYICTFRRERRPGLLLAVMGFQGQRIMLTTQAEIAAFPPDDQTLANPAVAA
jgi:adenylate kinase family enzyme